MAKSKGPSQEKMDKISAEMEADDMAQAERNSVTPNLDALMKQATQGPLQANGFKVEPLGAPKYELNDGWIICLCEGPDMIANARKLALFGTHGPALVAALKVIKQYYPDGRSIEHPLFHEWENDLSSGTDFHQWLAQRLLAMLEVRK